MKFVVTIEETVSQNFEVEAENIEDAKLIAERKYNNGEFVLEPGQIVSKQMAIQLEDGEVSEWKEF